MPFIYFILGLIVGILVRDIKFKTLETIDSVKKNIEDKGQAQFIEPVTPKEAFRGANTVDQLLENFNQK